MKLHCTSADVMQRMQTEQERVWSVIRRRPRPDVAFVLRLSSFSFFFFLLYTKVHVGTSIETFVSFFIFITWGPTRLPKHSRVLTQRPTRWFLWGTSSANNGRQTCFTSVLRLHLAAQIWWSNNNAKWNEPDWGAAQLNPVLAGIHDSQTFHKWTCGIRPTEMFPPSFTCLGRDVQKMYVVPPSKTPFYDGVGVRMLFGPGCLTSVEGRQGTLRGFPHEGHHRNLGICVLKNAFSKPNKQKKRFLQTLLDFPDAKRDPTGSACALTLKRLLASATVSNTAVTRWRRCWDVFRMLMAVKWSRTGGERSSESEAPPTDFTLQQLACSLNDTFNGFQCRMTFFTSKLWSSFRNMLINKNYFKRQ